MKHTILFQDDVQQAHAAVLGCLQEIDTTSARCEAEIMKCQKDISMALSALESFKNVSNK